MNGKRKELEHFYIGTSYGGNQDWFRSFMMRLGGCGAETACDTSLYFALHRGIMQAYPFDSEHLNKKEYVDFAHIMEGYLWPRMSGIDRTRIFMDGYSKYLADRGVSGLRMTSLEATEPYEAAEEAIRTQIDAGYPVPMLTLNIRDKSLSDYNWHWFLLNGYDETDPERGMLVKAVTYSSFQWIELRRLWETGYVRKGGIVLFSEE